MGKLISNLIKWAFFLAAIGQLKPAIMYFAREAAREQQRGLISLTALNRSLFGPGHAKTLCGRQTDIMTGKRGHSESTHKRHARKCDL